MMCCSWRTVLCRKLASTDCNASPHVNNNFLIINLRISTHLKVTPALSHRQEQVQLFFKGLSIGNGTTIYFASSHPSSQSRRCFQMSSNIETSRESLCLESWNAGLQHGTRWNLGTPIARWTEGVRLFHLSNGSRMRLVLSFQLSTLSIHGGTCTRLPLAAHTPNR